ncbi:MAG: alanine racemase [Bacilli bacterium]|jgi:alanine racemase|nr:alanine racemase [Bacilli bacterium]
MEKYYRNTWIEVNLDNIKANINELKHKCSKDKFLFAVIKGDGYGHGLKQVANIVVQSDAEGCAVATLDEALVVRKVNKDIKILVLGIIRDEDYQFAALNDITVTIANKHSLEVIKNLTFTKPLLIHIKVNSGMNRIGFNKIEEIVEVIDVLSLNKTVVIDGLFTHFATAEDYDKEEYFFKQLNYFKKVVQNLNYPFKFIHCTNSASLMKYSNIIDFTTANRAGIAIYYAIEDKIKNEYDLKPTFALKSKIAQVQTYPKGTLIGYSNSYQTTEDSEIIATIPLGYADGFTRLYGKSEVRCFNQYGRISANICMDQLMIKFNEPVNIGDVVTLIDNDARLDIYARNKQAQTISQETYARLGMRIPKIYYQNDEIVEIDNALLKK